MTFNFAKDAWCMDGLTYAYSYRFEEIPVFIQEHDCIRNSKDETAPQGFDNISLLTQHPCKPGTTITTRCSFDHFGAPLIMIAEQLHTDERGFLRYGNYLEIVLYEKGVNVWRMWLRDGKVSWKKLMSVEFPVAEKEIHTLSTKVTDERLEIEACGRKMTLFIPDMYPVFHAGINACENINRFYSLQIDKGE